MGQGNFKLAVTITVVVSAVSISGTSALWWYYYPRPEGGEQALTKSNPPKDGIELAERLQRWINSVHTLEVKKISEATLADCTLYKKTNPESIVLDKFSFESYKNRNDLYQWETSKNLGAGKGHELLLRVYEQMIDTLSNKKDSRLLDVTCFWIRLGLLEEKDLKDFLPCDLPTLEDLATSHSGKEPIYPRVVSSPAFLLRTIPAGVLKEFENVSGNPLVGDALYPMQTTTSPAFFYKQAGTKEELYKSSGIFIHKCPTLASFSGSPLLDDNYKLIGIHIGTLRMVKDTEYNNLTSISLNNYGSSIFTIQQYLFNLDCCFHQFGKHTTSCEECRLMKKNYQENANYNCWKFLLTFQLKVNLRPV